MNLRLLPRFRIPAAGLLVLLMSLSVTAAASADSPKARFDAAGSILYVGPAQAPAPATSSQANFLFEPDGVTIWRVRIRTHNEFVFGVLGGQGGTALTECRGGGNACATVDALLTGAPVSSLHESEAVLDVTASGTVALPGVPYDIPVLHGNLKGRIDGVFTIGSGSDSLTGRAQLRITNGSHGTYACFIPNPLGGPAPVPSPQIEACSLGLVPGGQMFPLALSVVDQGRFNTGQGTGAFAAIESMKGRIEVTAGYSSPFGPFGGGIRIVNARAELAQTAR